MFHFCAACVVSCDSYCEEEYSRLTSTEVGIMLTNLVLHIAEERTQTRAHTHFSY